MSNQLMASTALIMVMHSEVHAKRADRVVQMLDGRLVDSTEL
jgi:predicted ABC-type transport system involved in lysophospholipase L1 biosynthesis ATPase subunit